nr:tRNA guanosine(34) transglycosylase Tgt [Candidatus Levybacteria bacterium]
MTPTFKIILKSSKTKARAGVIKTPHGDIETPAFIPVGTNGTVKSVSPRDLKEMGAQVVLANTYHLHLRPGEDLIKEFGGLSKFMSWGDPTMTDSGGFQVFSLGVGLEHGVGKLLREEEGEAKPRLNKITKEGVTFQSHIDGSKQYLSPEVSIEIQEKIGADLIVAFDDLESPKYNHEETKKSLELTEDWLIRSIKAHKRKDQLLYGVTHGGSFKDLRIKSAKFNDKHFNAIALGGAHKNKQDMAKIVEWTIANISENKPRHMLGIGEVDDIFELIERGIDTFDCVIPTRIGRTGFFFASPPFGNIKNRFRMDIAKSKFAKDKGPLADDCLCYTCQNFTRAYLYHLFRSRELLAYSLISTHNVHFLVNLTKQIREAIIKDKFQSLKKKWLKKSKFDSALLNVS